MILIYLLMHGMNGLILLAQVFVLVISCRNGFDQFEGNPTPRIALSVDSFVRPIFYPIDISARKRATKDPVVSK